MRDRKPISRERGKNKLEVPAPVILPGIDITQSSVQVMSFGGNTTAASSGASSGDSAWTYPTLASGWTTNAKNPIRFRKLSNGLVYLTGSFALTVSYSSASKPPFTMPVGYRWAQGTGTAALSVDVCVLFAWTVGSSTGASRVSVYQNGEVAPSGLTFANDAVEVNGVWYAEA